MLSYVVTATDMHNSGSGYADIPIFPKNDNGNYAVRLTLLVPEDESILKDQINETK